MTRYLWVPGLHRIAFAMLFAGLSPAYASSLGPIQLLSGLGQPLHVTIPLSSDNVNDLGSACVRARLELTDGTFISAPRISLTRIASTNVIDLSTKQSINEPAVTLHVEIGCGTTIRRNYQLLLDPVNAAVIARTQKAAGLPGTFTPRLATTERSVKEIAVNGAQRNQPAVEKTALAPRTDVVTLPTFTKEMSLSSNRSVRKAPGKASEASTAAKWVAEDSITPILKLSAGLADISGADDARKNEEFRAEQTRFSAIVNGEDITQNAEMKMRAVQEKMLRLQAENEQKKLQAQSEKAAQDEKRKVSFPLIWFAGLGALLLICLVVIGWIVSRLIKARRSPAPHAWKNYHVASDTLIADLSTQTLLDSEFLNTAGESYNTAVFSDTEYDLAPVTECEIPDDELEDEAEDEHPLSDSVTIDPTTIAPVAPDAESSPIETSAIPKSPAPVQMESSAASKAEDNAKANLSPVDAPAPVLPPAQPSTPTVNVAKREDSSNTSAASAPIAKPAPTALAVPAVPAKEQKENAATLNVKEIADIMQQAEFWMLLQDPFRAIEILEPYRDVAHPESPAPWIYLLDLYRMVGDKKKYELLLVRIEYVFNAKIPRWDGQFGITPRTLNDFPHVVEKICVLWETEGVVPYLESLLIDQRDGTRQGFDLPVYRNIVQLITLARDPDKSKEHEQLRYGKAQAILFSQQPAQPEQVERSVASKPAAAAAQDTTVHVEPDRENTKLEAASVSDGPDQIPTAAAPVIAPAVAPINVDTENTAVLNEPPIGAASFRVAEPDQKNADDNVEYDNASQMETKLELVLAYQEIGEKDGARELLYEVIKDGSPEQSEKARLILKRIN